MKILKIEVMIKNNNFFRLHQEINDFFKWMVPTREEHQMRITVVQKIENCIQACSSLIIQHI